MSYVLIVLVNKYMVVTLEFVHDKDNNNDYQYTIEIFLIQ